MKLVDYGICQWSFIYDGQLSCHAEQVRQRVTNLVCKAYKTIKLADLCTLLGQSEETVKQGTADQKNRLVMNCLRAPLLIRT